MKGIEIKNLSKFYGTTAALDGVNVVFEEKKIYGLLGRNGAGKSTMLNILSSRIFAGSGEIFVDGQPLKENETAMKKMVLTSEWNMFPEKFKVKDAFRWGREFFPDFDVDYANRLAEEFKLNVKQRIRKLSTGYNSIFKNILALSTNVPYVLLDEPVLGLDANHRDLFYRVLLEKYSEEPFCVVISTHLIEEVSSVVEDIVIIKEGKILLSDTRDELLSRGYMVAGNSSMVDLYCKDKQVIGMDSIGGFKTAYILGKPNRASLPDGLEIMSMDLQKLFVQLTN